MAEKKKKNRQMAAFGRKGDEALREKLGEEGYKKHQAKNAQRRWAKHPEQRAKK